MQDEHALFLSHFLSLPPITTVDDWQVSPSITDSAVAMCVSESAVREGQGSLCTLAVGGGGDYTVAEDWITERGGAALTISFFQLLQKCSYQRGLFCGLDMYHNFELFLEFI